MKFEHFGRSKKLEDPSPLLAFRFVVAAVVFYPFRFCFLIARKIDFIVMCLRAGPTWGQPAFRVRLPGG